MVLPWGVLPLEADGVRSSNPWLQLHFQSTVEGLLHRRIGLPTVVELPHLQDLDARLAWVVDQLEESRLLELIDHPRQPSIQVLEMGQLNDRRQPDPSMKQSFDRRLKVELQPRIRRTNPIRLERKDAPRKNHNPIKALQSLETGEL